jgi:hypothetical protein
LVLVTRFERVPINLWEKGIGVGKKKQIPLKGAQE